MKTFRAILTLMISLLVISGCMSGIPGLGGTISESRNPGSYCSLRYERGMKRPFFHEAKISADPEKAVIVLYQPYDRRCGGDRNREVILTIFINDKKITDNLRDDHFTVLKVDPKKLKFSATKKIRIFTHDSGELGITPEAGKTYFLRWYKGASWTCKKCFQLVDEKTAQRELNGVMYLAPQAFKAPVFDKKTGKPL